MLMLSKNSAFTWFGPDLLRQFANSAAEGSLCLSDRSPTAA